MAAHKAYLFGYLVSALIFAVLLYALLFHVRHDAIKSCQRVNVTRHEINERQPILNELVKLEKHERAEHTPKQLAQLHSAGKVTIPNCEDKFDKPWPFGGI